MPETENDQALDGQLRVRINLKELDIFEKKADRTLGEPRSSAPLLRKIVSAFNDGRLRIIQTPDEEKLTGELYNVTGK